MRQEMTVIKALYLYEASLQRIDNDFNLQNATNGRKVQ
jgi:hypothetical protein